MRTERKYLKAALVGCLVLLPLFAIIRLGPLVRFNWGVSQFDNQWTVYVGGLVDGGVNPYNPHDRPKLRDSEFEPYNSWLPPTNLLLLGGVRAAASAVAPNKDPLQSFARAFAFFDALVGVLLFYLIYALGDLSITSSAILSALWYGLSPLVITSNVFTPEDKPIYTLMVLLLFLLLWHTGRAEHSPSRVDRLFVASSAAVGFTAGYRLMTLIVAPVLLVWGWAALTRRKGLTLIVGAAAFCGVFALTMVPYFPYSLAVFQQRGGLLEAKPSAASIWQWLPFFRIGEGSLSLSLPAFVSVCFLAVLLVLVFRRRTTLVLAAALSCLVPSLIATVDGSLDRAILGWTPLVLFLAIKHPKVMTVAGLVTLVVATPVAYHSIHVIYNEPLEALYALGVLIALLCISAYAIREDWLGAAVAPPGAQG